MPKAPLVQSAATFGAADLVLIMLASDAGMRSGEINVLRWADQESHLQDLADSVGEVLGAARSAWPC